MSEEKTDPYARLQDRLAKTADGLEYPQAVQKKPSMIFLFGLIESPIFSQTSWLVTIVF